MEIFGNVHSQDESPSDRRAGAGVRKPRSGSIRKPRLPGHSAKYQDSDSPTSGNLLNPLSTQGEKRDVSRLPPEDLRVPSGGSFPSAEKLAEPLGDSPHHMHSMDDGDSRTEWKMFQRREKRRDDERPADRDTNKIGVRGWKISDGSSDKASGKVEVRKAASPEYERMKKLNRSWKEKEPTERQNKDANYWDKSEPASKNTWSKEKGSHLHRDSVQRDRSDHPSKDRPHKDRDRGFKGRDDDRVHKDNARDRDHEKVRRLSDSRDNTWKSKDGSVRSDSLDKPTSQHSQSGVGRTGQNHGYSMLKGSGMLAGEHGYHRNIHGSRGTSGTGEESRGGLNTSAGYIYGGSAASSSPLVYERKNSAERNSADSRPLTKLKLKVGGITHTIHSDGPKRSENNDQMDGGTTQTQGVTGIMYKRHPKSAPEALKRRQRLILQDDSDDDDDDGDDDGDGDDDDDDDTHPGTKSKDDSSLSYAADEPSYGKDEVFKESSLAAMSRQTLLNGKDSSHPVQGVRKSSRVPKKRVFDNDDDIELEPKRRRKKKVEVDSDEDLYRIEEDEVDDEPIDDDDEDIEAIGGDDKLKVKRRRRKKAENDIIGGDNRRAVGGDRKPLLPGDTRNGIPLTARQRALQSSKEGLADVGSSLIEFPDGLSALAPKKQKEVLTAAERQIKKEEAARKRRQQVEKAAKEIQAVAIQKILCQDSQRKKREGKLQKQREEMEQEKKAAAMVPASNSIRWVFGPNGNVVSFSEDVELPNIFSGPLSYPQERERCAGPSCTNAYKYRDSKTLLPLCSLQCYRAVQRPSGGTLAH